MYSFTYTSDCDRHLNVSEREAYKSIIITRKQLNQQWNCNITSGQWTCASAECDAVYLLNARLNQIYWTQLKHLTINDAENFYFTKHCIVLKWNWRLIITVNIVYLKIIFNLNGVCVSFSRVLTFEFLALIMWTSIGFRLKR